MLTMSLLDQIDLVDLAERVIETHDAEGIMEIKQNGQSEEDVNEIISFIDELCELLRITIRIEVI